ncbi:MAG: alanine--tRNA ligase [Pseudomonadota bacterium]
MSSATEIRAAFLDFFVKNGHEELPSSSLVPINDPTLMFTNAGMVQFKNVFTGLEKKDFSRAVTSQKCVRAGGKHNDLDNVGYTARHHTFFEMLGNFSFGDYFKERAIELAWTLVTREFGLPAERLLVTVYSGDEEAFELWKKIAGLADDRIIRIPTSDNFWAMGPVGPCGPCSEIFFDHGDKIPGGPPGSPYEDGDRFIEIWNLVFMQFEQLSEDERVDLPRPSIDTGMGLERISAVLQGKHDNYDIDLMRTLIEASAHASNSDPDGPHKTSHRVIADHLRASSFLIADGVLPSNEGRGYVLRRIMRRAMRHAEMIGVAEPLLYRLVPTLVREMGTAFPELSRGQSLIEDTLSLEERRFRKTLARGVQILADETKLLGEGDTLPGDVAFKLYDTYGFPLDLTQDALRARSISVDVEGFNTAMDKQKADARAAWAGSGDTATDDAWFSVRNSVGATEFVGYETLEAEAVVTAIIVDGESKGEVATGKRAAIVTNQTPFYGESGGQVGDLGVISTSTGAVFLVKDTQKKLGDLFVHTGVMENGSLREGEAVLMSVDRDRRLKVRSNHSATHLLHEALRKVLGNHVAQKGSLVAPDRLRFDFSHTTSISDENLHEIEQIANEIILQNAPVSTRLMDVESAMAEGAMALFGEKYGDEVRVVSMGREDSGSVYSLELCGGTHVDRTGDIGMVTIVSEGAVAAGVRRLEAMTGSTARTYLEGREKQLRSAASLLRTTPDEVGDRIKALLDEKKLLEAQLFDARKKLASGQNDGSDAVQSVGDVRLLSKIVDGIPPKELKGVVDQAKDELGSGVVAIIGRSDDGKAGVVVGVTDDLTTQFNAVDLVRIASAALGGKGGGGRPDMAQAGGPDASRAKEALSAIKDALDAA